MMKDSRRSKHSLALVGSLALAAAITQPAFAQETPAHDATGQEAVSQDGQDDAGALGEIVVTARKRSESLQDTPIAISAMSADDLEARSTVDIADIDGFTPNVTINATAAVSGSSNATSIFIRGVGQSDFLLSTDPGVGVYLDGVYIARSVGGVLGLLDIEQVEVLRGPQGTLFGKNTIGGAINVTTRKPGPIFEAESELSYGRFDRIEARGFVNVPIADTLAARVSAGYKNSDGYGRRVLTGQRLGGDNEFTVRGALRWTPSSVLDINLAVDYTTADEDSPVTTTVAGTETPMGGPTTLFTGLLYNNLIGAPGGVPGTISMPALPADTVRYDERFVTGNLYESFATGPTGSKFDIFGISGTVELDLGSASIKSITAYRHLDTLFGRDPDGSPLTLIETTNDITHRQFSQEFQISGTAFGDRLKYLAGVYYLNEKGGEVATVPFAQEAFDLLAAQGAVCTLFPGSLNIVLPCASANVFRIDNVDDGVRLDNESFAAFGEATFELTDRLSITAGARWTRDKKGLDLSNQRVGGVPTITGNPVAKESFSDATFRGIVDYQLNDDVLFYASYSEGFKSGGINLRYGRPVADPTPYGPESVRSFEAGLKSEFWDRRARINAAVFHSNYDDIQVVVFDAGIPRNINAARGKISGFEIEGTFMPGPEWLIQTSYGYLDARYTKLDPAITGSFGTPIVNPLRIDDEFVNSPKHSFSLGGQYAAPLADWGTLTLRGDLSHRSSYVNDAVNTPELKQDALTLLSARVVLEPADERWSLAFYGRNLTNERYIISGSDGGFGGIEVNAAAPVEWGVSFRVKFGG